MASNINSEYEELIASVVEQVVDTAKTELTTEPDLELDELDLTSIVQEEMDQRIIYYTDQAYCLAHYFLNECDTSGTIEWTNVWEMVFNDIYNDAYDELKKSQD